MNLPDLNIKIFADSAHLESLSMWNKADFIQGFTTNPTLMRQADVKNYETFAHEALSFIRNKPISFEVFSDDFETMYREACQIASWSDNVFVKIPITNTHGISSAKLIKQLAKAGVKQNITAVMTTHQFEIAADNLSHSNNHMISIFAGRIADTGHDPLPIMQSALHLLKQAASSIELIWASPREIFNIFQANQIGCHIITLTPDLLRKLSCIGKDLETYSLETIQMFYQDAQKSGFYLTQTENIL